MKNIFYHIKKYIFDNWQIIVPLFIFFVVVLVLFLLQEPIQDDVRYHDQVINDYGGWSLNAIFKIVSNRYKYWSSRIFIDALLFSFVMIPTTFRILNAFVATFCLFFLFKIPKQKNIYIYSIITVLTLGINYKCFQDVGIIATSLNYLWPMAFSIPSIIIVLRILRNEEIKHFKIITVLSFLGLILITLWQEVFAVGFFIFFLIALIYIFFIDKNNRKRGPNTYLLLSFLFLTVVFLIIELTCPGNAKRRETQSEEYPIYKTYNIFQKLNMAICSGFRFTTSHTNAANWTFFSLLIFMNFKSNKNLLVRINSIIPMLYSIVYNIIFYKLVNTDFWNNYIYNILGVSGITMTFMCFCYIHIAIGILFSTPSIKNNLFILVVFGVAVVSSSIPGYIPAFWNSWIYRTAFPIFVINLCISIYYFSILLRKNEVCIKSQYTTAKHA